MIDDLTMLKIARELAIDLHDLPTILQHHSITENTWEVIRVHPRFNQLLAGELQAWQSAGNTHERTKLKAAAMLEEWLPEAYSQLHNPTQPLSARTELAKLISGIAGLGGRQGNGELAAGERFTITINLGADQQLKYEKDITPRVIEGKAIPDNSDLSATGFEVAA